MSNTALNKLDHLSLNDMAEFFESLSDECRKKSVQKATQDSETIAMGVSYLINAPRLVCRYLSEGYTLDEAFNEVSEELRVPYQALENTWKRFLADKSLYEMKRRNVLILQLACLGFSNADIGKKVGLHPNSVSRIISKSRRDYKSASKVGNNKIQMLLAGGMPDNDNYLF